MDVKPRENSGNRGFAGRIWVEDQDFNLVPELAESYTNNGAVFTFKIRKDANWSDGTPVTAKDVVLSFQRMTDPRTGTTTTELTNLMRGEPDASLFSVPSDYTLRKGPGGPGGRGPGGGPPGGEGGRPERPE